MDEVDFEWDEAKSRLNIRNHGLSFEVAREAFDDMSGPMNGKTMARSDLI